MTDTETKLAEALSECLLYARNFEARNKNSASLRRFISHCESLLAAYDIARAQPANFLPDWPDGPDREPPAQPASVPDGWVMVPRDPTAEMLRAEDGAVPTDEAVCKDPYVWGRASWKAFLAAAPQPAKENDND